MKNNTLTFLIILAGCGQIFTAIVYPLVRYKVLDWFEDLNNLNPLNQAIAKTYGYYIQGINFAMGLLSITLYNELLIPSLLTISLVGFMALYWIGRISFQLKDYNFNALKQRKYFTTGIWGMNLLIAFFALTYSLVFIQLIINL